MVVLATFAAFVCLGIFPPTASALPPCGPGDQSDFVPSYVPPKLSWGTYLTLEFEPAPVGAPINTFPVDDGNARISVAALDPNHPISNPVDVSGSIYALATKFAFAKGNGPALVSFQSTESLASTYPPQPYCQRIQTFTTSPIRGSNPKIKVKRNRPYFEARVKSDCKGAKFFTTSTGAITFSVKEKGGRRAHVAQRDQCEGGVSGKRKVKRRGWSLVNYPFLDELDFLARFKSPGRHSFTYKVSLRGDTLKRGKFFVRTKVKPRKTVWEGSDAFVNYCINQTKTIKSQGGRLYCVKPKRIIQAIT